MGKPNLDKRTLELEQEDFKNDKRSSNKPSKVSRKKVRKYRDFRKNKYKGKESNDVQWHLKNSDIVKDLANIPFNTMMGFPPRTKTAGNVKYILGCIRSYFYDWFAGLSEDFRSFLNAAATNIWEFIRSRNSGSTNYQSADIFVNVILGCLDIIATAEYLARFFGMTTMYSAYNRMIPRELFNLCGIDYEDFITNEANYRGRYNILLAKASSIVVPDQFPIINWITSLGHDVYKDRDSETGREQLMIGVKEHFHIFDPTMSPEGGMVRLMRSKDVDGLAGGVIAFGPNMPNKQNKFQLLLDIWEAQINAIITDEDCNIIFGDMIKAYGSEGKFWKTSPLTEGYKVTPVYSEEFLYQFHNSTTLPARREEDFSLTANSISVVGTNNINNIKQDGNGYLVTEYRREVPELDIDEINLMYKDDCRLILDTNFANPSPEDIMTMTRWHNRYKYTTFDGLHYLEIITASAVLISEGEITFISQEGAISRVTAQQFFKASSPTQFYGRSPLIAAIIASNFDWQPICYIFDNTVADPAGAGIVLLADLNNLQAIEWETVQRIHEVDFASLYDVPFTGKF